MQNRNLSRKTLITVLLIVATFLLVAVLDLWPRHDQPVSVIESNLKRILIDLQDYYAKHRSLPFSPEGPEHALYELRSLTDVSYFDCDPNKPATSRAFWDNQNKRLSNADFLYLNESSLKPDFFRVIMMSRPGLDPNSVYLGTGSARILVRKAVAADSRFLGSCITPEGFLIADFKLFQEWSRTHPESITKSSTLVDVAGHCRILRAQGGGISIDYSYDGGRLSKCYVTTTKGMIEETVGFDDLGRISELSRKPDPWQRLLGEEH